MVCSFVAFSVWRFFVASAIAESNSATAFVSSLMSSVNFEIDASNWSISACKVSTASVFSFRVCSFVESSVSHQPLCSASSFASSMRRTMRSLIIFFTFANGSSATRTASAESTRLFNLSPLARKNSATRSCGSLDLLARNCASAEPFFCAKDGKYFSELPFTALLDKISTAFSIASISSARSCCLDSKSDAFCSQVATKSERYFSSASLVVVVSLKSPSASALACNFFAFVSAFSPRSVVACSICAVKSCTNMSKACLLFISAFSKAVRSSTNLSWSFSNISMMPWDLNS
mmetsp:Transcript_92272/g.266311  ORF Transcript_92272/g.266311 Transcript_92272/m.266311 type:complete len:291 (+) Transcript_92272:622-1494(+)